MELILTSFGLSHLTRHRDVNLRLLATEMHVHPSLSLFDYMPPMSSLNHVLTPDYPVFFLCDRLVVDAESFERLTRGEHHQIYKSMAQTVRGLFDEGFIRIEDFVSIIRQNQSLLEIMLQRDLKRLDEWAKPLLKSIQTWQEFIESVNDFYREADFKQHGIENSFHKSDTLVTQFHQSLHVARNNSFRLQILSEALNSSTKRRRAEYREVLRDVLTEYLAYVNSNLILSRILDAGFYDWSDFEPFYREKFLNIGQTGRAEDKAVQTVRQLFEVSFPQYMPNDSKSVLRALKDKRIHALRDLINRALKGEIVFDQEFANRTLQEVLGTEQRLSRIRNIVSYATIPIGFVPMFGTPVQKAVEEVIDRAVAKKIKGSFQWFYLISETARAKT